MTNNSAIWQQRRINLKPRPRGFHLITAEITANLPDIQQIDIGLLHLFIQHTSASLSINENADPTVRDDMEAHLNNMVPENCQYFTHTYEGPDDMPAHIKSSLMGNHLSIPIGSGKLLLGTWQGIYLGEHRNHATGRVLIATLQGQPRAC